MAAMRLSVWWRCAAHDNMVLIALGCSCCAVKQAGQ